MNVGRRTKRRFNWIEGRTATDIEVCRVSSDAQLPGTRHRSLHSVGERDKVPVLCCAPARPGLKWLRPGSARSEIEFQVHPTTREEKRKIKSWLALQLGSNDQQSPSGNPLSSSPLYTLRPPPGPARHGAPTTVQKCANHFLLLLLSNRREEKTDWCKMLPTLLPFSLPAPVLSSIRTCIHFFFFRFFKWGKVENRRRKTQENDEQ